MEDNSMISETIKENEELNSLNEENLISEENKEKYFIWKKNSSYLYDYLQTSSLNWPSLTVDWFPETEVENDEVYTYRLLLGTYTSGLSDEKLKIDNVKIKNLNSLINPEFDNDQKEYLISNNDRNQFKKIQNILEINHQGEINKAKYMPQNIDIISTINNNGKVYIFDRKKHSTILSKNDFKPQITGSYHTMEGFGLDWNLQNEAKLLSAAMDGDAVLWDIKKFESSNSQLSPAQFYKNIHDKGVNDVKWSPKHDSIFGSVGEDRSLKVLDTRIGKSIKESYTTGDRINCLSFNPDNMYCIATGNSAGELSIWDLRNLSQTEYSIKSHNGNISTIDWSPHDPKIIATAGQDDNLVKIWDFTKENDHCLFVHGGHMLGVNDISWNVHNPWLISSVSNDNSLHIWKASKSIVG